MVVVRAVLRLVCLVACVEGIALTVSTTGGNASSPLLYGLMFEEINHSGDGTLHGQLLQNNGFQGAKPQLTAYGTVGNVALAIDSANPLTAAIRNSLKVSVPAGAKGQVGISNSGYWGIPVNDDNYTSYFWIKGEYEGPVTFSLKGNVSGITHASHTIDIKSNANAFTYVDSGVFPSTQAPDGYNLWTLTFDGAKIAGSAINLALVQLFPTTYKNRANGLRPNVAQAINDIGGSFLRFPGGNNLEGHSSATRWKWNETIGPVENRPGRQGDWTYPNTDALGLVEYFLWCQDMNLTPVLAIWSGLSLDRVSLTGLALKPYVDDALAELEFLLGPPTTPGGSLRTSLGFPDPFPVPYVQIGNEDMWGGAATYAERFMAYYTAIRAAYPTITIITSTPRAQDLPHPFPAGAMKDVHHYETPDQFVKLFNEFDNADRAVGMMVGEFASTRWNGGAKSYWTSMVGSVSEAVYMIGLERNSDVVKMACYAPLLQLWNSTQWTPDLIGYNTNPDGLILSTSYHVQQMFARHRGATILPVTADTPFRPVFWVASAAAAPAPDARPTYHVKLANYGAAPQTLRVTVPGTTRGTLVVLSGPERKQNIYGQQTLLRPVETEIGAGEGGVFAFDMPGWSVVVLSVS